MSSAGGRPFSGTLGLKDQLCAFAGVERASENNGLGGGRCYLLARPHPTVQVSRAATEDGHQGDREPERSSLWAHPLSFTRHGTAQQ